VLRGFFRGIATARRSQGRFRANALFGIVILGLAGCGRASQPGHDDGAVSQTRREEAVALTDRAVGLMEQFNFPAAAEAFAAARRINPASRVLRINHAIALLNTATDANLNEARGILRDVIVEVADDPHAHFCLGIIALHRNELDEARPHFEAVTRIDPSDPSGWYHLGMTLAPGSTEATACFEKALALNPNLSSAMHGLAMNLRRTDPKRARALLTGQEALLGAEWDEPLRIRYGEMGRYGEVIVAGIAVGDRPPLHRMAELLPEQSPPFGDPQPLYAFGPATDDNETAPAHDVHARFGSVILPVSRHDVDRIDLLLLDRGRLAFLESAPGHGMRNATADHPDLAALDARGGTLAVAAGDFDNDGRTDLVITMADPSRGVRILRNDPEAGFVDVTEAAISVAPAGPALGSSWVDLDQDGDLDLVIARPEASGGTVVLLNISAAPPTVPHQAPPPLQPGFREVALEGLSGLAAATVLVSDLDDDRDLDLILLGEPLPHVIWNDRLLRFRPQPLKTAMQATTASAFDSAQAGLSFDREADGLFKRLLLRRDAPPLLEAVRGEFRVSDMPALRQAATADLDLDGRTDLVGLDGSANAVYALNRHGMLTVGEALANAQDPVVAICPIDLDGDRAIDLVWLTRSGHLVWRKNMLSGRHALRMVVTGRRDKATSLRTNSDGVGARVVALAGPVVASCENTSLTAGLGQPRLPIHLGIGPAEKADVVRLVWPDGVPQAELDVPADRTVRIEETSRKTTSCPVLFAWNGTAFQFVTDFLGGGVTGETLADGSIRSPRPHETVAITPPPAIVTQDGSPTVRLLITEPFDEVLYLDTVRLVACDHPAELGVIPDERFPGAGPEPTGDLLVVGPAIVARRVVTDSGDDVTDLMTNADGRMTTPPQNRSWLGYARLHAIDLDFGDQLTELTPPVVLEAIGWTDYPYPESMWAANQAGIALETPRLLHMGNNDDTARSSDVGFFAGLPRPMGRVLEEDFLTHGPAQFRLATSMQIGWDRIALRPLLQRLAAGTGQALFTRSKASPLVRRHVLPLRTAHLRYAGLAREIAVGDSGLVTYDASVRHPLPITRWDGDFSPIGSVLSKVTSPDHAVAICGPGHDIDCCFDAGMLPALPRGWTRSWFLEATGYTRDTSPLTHGGGRVSPLPGPE
jgi:Flp pilus assembly protein TadD